MSNDRELLELAARAAGYDVEWKEWRTSRIAEFGAIKYTKHAGFWVESKQWDPLADDADAFRLMVRLGLLVDVMPDRTEVTWPGSAFYSLPPVRVEHGGDAAAATRRAIVMAAAEMATC